MRNPLRKTHLSPDFSWRGLTVQLLVIIVLPLAGLLLAITFSSINLHQGAMRALVGERDQRAVRAAAASLDDQIRARVSELRTISILPRVVDPRELEAAFASSADLLASFDAGLAFLASDGSMLSLNSSQAFWENITQEGLPAVQSLPPEFGPLAFISQAFRDPENDDLLAMIAVRDADSGWTTAGVFSVTQMVSRSLLTAFPSNEQIGVLVVDRSFQYLYQAGDMELSEGAQIHSGVLEALNGISGTTLTTNAGEEHMVAYSPVPTTGWALVVEEPWEMVASPLLRTTELVPVVLVSILFLALLALWFGARQIVQPLQSLGKKAAALSWGDFKAIEEPVGGVSEVRRLQQELIYMTQKVRSAQQGLRGYISAITAGQEEERRRLARELHDDTLQAMIALKQRVQFAHMVTQNGQAAQALEDVEDFTEQSIINLRRLTRALRPSYLEDLGLVAALDMLTRETAQVTGIPFDFHQEGMERRLDPSVELALYRMVQEALSNIARHAEAARAAVQISFRPEAVILEVQDNGRGFEVPQSPAEFAPSGHYGLLGLYERAELIGATLKIESGPGQGTRLRIVVPA